MIDERRIVDLTEALPNRARSERCTETLNISLGTWHGRQKFRAAGSTGKMRRRVVIQARGNCKHAGIRDEKTGKEGTRKMAPTGCGSRAGRSTHNSKNLDEGGSAMGHATDVLSNRRRSGT